MTQERRAASAGAANLLHRPQWTLEQPASNEGLSPAHPPAAVMVFSGGLCCRPFRVMVVVDRGVDRSAGLGGPRGRLALHCLDYVARVDRTFVSRTR